MHDDDDNAICVTLVCTLLEDGTLDWRSSCFLSDILRIIKQAMEQRGVFRLQRIYRVRTMETLIEIHGDFTCEGERLGICRHPSAERVKKDRIRLPMATKCFSDYCPTLLLQTSCAATGQLLGLIYLAKGNQAEAPSLDHVRQL